MSNLPMVKDLLSNRALEVRLVGLGADVELFKSALLNILSESKQLQNCDPNSIVKSALKCVSLKLPIDKELGFAYIVPYGRQAQFQLGYKGYVQLAIRSGEYVQIKAVDVFVDEFSSYNPLTGELEIKPFTGELGDRQKGGSVVGYYSYFELKNGFKSSLFMTSQEVFSYAKKYSKAFQYDLNKGLKKSPWSTEFDAMGRKTVLKILLRNYGILSIDMQTALSSDIEEDVVPEEVVVNNAVNEINAVRNATAEIANPI